VARGTNSSFQRWAGYAAIGTGIGGFHYSVAFFLNARPAPQLGAGLSWALLMIGGLLATVVMVALHERLREVAFGFAGLGLLGFATLMRRSPQFPDRLGLLGVVTGIALIVVYLGRLILYYPTNPVVLVAAGLTGFILAPAWYIWLGLVLGDHAIDR